ncbi:MAG TPA: hypothetical protein VFT04_11195 [Gemmatimonadales bacterium]|nr:hypothetical protein [Gemmatimonadales bacterium]
MNLQSVRTPARDPREPVSHLLDPLRIADREITVSLTVRLAEDGAWRGRLSFVETAEPLAARETAEIFCGDTEDELWQGVQRLREHHFRDLFRSLS